MRTAAILPVKHLAHAKQRLGASLAEELRAELARAMVGDVLLALDETRSIEQTIVVTGADSIAAAARDQGALVVADPIEESQSAAVALGVERALAKGFERVLCVPGDCPALDPAQLDALLRQRTPGDPRHVRSVAVAGAVVIVPDRHGTGTNGLLLTPPDAIVASFGPGSFARHRALAREAGASCRVQRPPSLLLDIDTGEDLAVLRERLGAERGARASRTRKLLGVDVYAGAVSITAGA
jgi:2-phospho-L-lactate/phosphoenolpyruvate guanylyltransferase